MSDYVAVAKLAAIDFAVQWGAFVFAALFQSDKYFDLTGNTSSTAVGLVTVTGSRSFNSICPPPR